MSSKVSDMEVDSKDNHLDNTETAITTITDGGKFANLKAFVNAACEFEATHCESAVNLMTRYLGLIASSCDLSIFSPGRSEVCAFFSSLWRVMSDGRGPHWAAVAVLARACIEPSARHALTHTYKFLPILSRLLSDSISNEKKIKLLSVMQDISYGIKINWQESYLSTLMKQLTEFILEPTTELQQRTISHKSLTVLVNVCYGNLPAIYALMRTIDTMGFVKHLVSMKDGGYGGVEVCRLLLCLAGVTRGGPVRQSDIQSYLSCTMKTFSKAVVEKDPTQMLHAYTFLNDLSANASLRSHVLSYPHFTDNIRDSLENLEALCKTPAKDVAEPEALVNCLQYTLKFLTLLVNLDEGRLPQQLISVISDGLPGLLLPPALEPGKSGLQWLQALGALCETSETQEKVLHEVTPEAFEDTLYSVLQYASQQGSMGSTQSQAGVILGCRCALALAPLSTRWEAALGRLLAHQLVRRSLCGGLSGADPARRRQVLQLVKHHYFPVDMMNQVFSDQSPFPPIEETSPPLSEAAEEDAWCGRLAPCQEQAVDDLVRRLGAALRDNKISDIATSSVMELYGYKMTCLEQRLHSHSVALQGATDHMASLQHALAMLQATNSAQQDVLYTTQMHNEKHKSTIDQLLKQVEDAENTMRGFRAKLANERLDKDRQKEALQKEFRMQITIIENQIKEREKEAENEVKQAEAEVRAVQKKLEQQTAKNGELASVLIKFEERVKQRDKRLEECAAADQAHRREVELKDATIKQLEKKILERENRLYQLTTQLEEMKRVQEMVAKLMTKSGANINTNNS